MNNALFSIFQIYYDQNTRNNIEPGFIPLDNSSPEGKGWFELYPIRKFLKENKLKDRVFYGFLSPNFVKKSGFPSKTVIDVLCQYNDAEVALFSIRWDQLAYFRNPFEQGEQAHPGITEAAQEFLDYIGYDLNIKSLVTYSENSVFSNYILAKKGYWDIWMDFAEKLYFFSESKPNAKINNFTHHRNARIQLKVFVQERLPCLILASNQFKTVLDQSGAGPIVETFFSDNIFSRRRLQSCDLLKEKYFKTGDRDYLDMFYKLRNEIPLNRPIKIY